MSSVKPVYNIVTGYTRVEEIETGDIYDVPNNKLIEEEGYYFIEVAVNGPLSWLSRRERRQVVLSNEEPNVIQIANLHPRKGIKL